MSITDIVRENKEVLDAFNRNWVKSATFLNEKYKTEYTNEQIRVAYNNAEKREMKFEQTYDESRMRLKSVWYNGKEWCESYRVNDTLEWLEEFKKSFFEDLKLQSERVEYTPSDYYSPDSTLVEISLPDFHFGKEAGVTIEKQTKQYFEAVRSLITRLKGYNIDRILLPIGNDMLNYDTASYTTTAGTTVSTNGHYHEVFKHACFAVINAVDYLQEIAPVDIVVVQGNHDTILSIALGEVVEARFYNNERVSVMNNAGEWRKYYQYGRNLIGFTHGNNEKSTELPLIMAVEQPVMFAECPYRVWHLGHFHKHMVDEYQGVQVAVLPSLVDQDDWHRKMGYNSPKRAQAYIYNVASGPEGYIQINK